MGYKEAFQLENFNTYHNLSFRENLGNSWKIQLGTSYSNNKDDIDGSLQGNDNKKVVLQDLEYLRSIFSTMAMMIKV